MTEMRAALTRDGAMMVQVVGDMTRLANPPAPHGIHPLAPWIKAFPPHHQPQLAPTSPPAPPRAVLQPGEARVTGELHAAAVGEAPGVCKVVAMGAIESGFLYAASPGLPAFQHPDTAAMLVATELLTCIEGPMVRAAAASHRLPSLSSTCLSTCL